MSATRRLAWGLAVGSFMLTGCGGDGDRRDSVADKGRHDPERVAKLVVSILAQQTRTDRARITRETHLSNDLKLTPRHRVAMVMGLEDVFAVRISDADAARFQTVGEVIDHIVSRSP